ncbi:Zinc finger protein [Globisporangium polare]
MAPASPTDEQSPRRSTTSSVSDGLYAIFSCCFQPTHAGPGDDDESIYMSQQQMSNRKLSFLSTGGSFMSTGGGSASSGKGDAPSIEQSVVLAGYQAPPRWVKDEVIDACSLCSDAFDLFNRKHHCRGCGLVYCKACASNSDRVVKFGFLEPVRLCNTCVSQATLENEFYEKHLPLLEAGDVLNKYGLLRKRAVQFKFIRSKSILQYQRIDMELRQFHGEIKAISLDMVTSVREAALDKDCPDLGFVIVAGDQEHKFDAASAHKRTQWVQAIRSARDVRNALIAVEREKRAKLIAQENDEIKKMAESMRGIEDRKASFHEDRLRKRAEKRESLRAKYSISSSSTSTA